MQLHRVEVKSCKIRPTETTGLFDFMLSVDVQPLAAEEIAAQNGEEPISLAAAQKILYDLSAKRYSGFFSISFLKREPPYPLRTYKGCRFAVKKFLKTENGEGKAYDFKSKDLLSVWVSDRNDEGEHDGYKCVNMRNIVNFRVGGKKYRVVGTAKKKDVVKLKPVNESISPVHAVASLARINRLDSHSPTLDEWTRDLGVVPAFKDWLAKNGLPVDFLKVTSEIWTKYCVEMAEQWKLWAERCNAQEALKNENPIEA